MEIGRVRETFRSNPLPYVPISLRRKSCHQSFPPLSLHARTALSSLTLLFLFPSLLFLPFLDSNSFLHSFLHSFLLFLSPSLSFPPSPSLPYLFFPVLLYIFNSLPSILLSLLSHILSFLFLYLSLPLSFPFLSFSFILSFLSSNSSLLTSFPSISLPSLPFPSNDLSSLAYFFFSLIFPSFSPSFPSVFPSSLLFPLFPSLLNTFLLHLHSIFRFSFILFDALLSLSSFSEVSVQCWVGDPSAVNVWPGGPSR